MNPATEAARRRADKFWSDVVDSIHNGAVPLVQAVELSTEGPALWADLARHLTGVGTSLERSAVPLRRVTEAIPRRCLEAGIRIVGRLAAWKHSSPTFREAAALLHLSWIDRSLGAYERATAFLETEFPYPANNRLPEGQREWAIQVLRYVNVLLLARQEQQNPFRFVPRELFYAASEVLGDSEIAAINFGLGPPSTDEVVNAALGVNPWPE